MKTKLTKFTDWFISKSTDFLSSRTGFWLAFIGPLVVLIAGSTVQRVENIISSNWIQLWALFGMSILANEARHHAKQSHNKIKKIHEHLGIEDAED